MLANISSFVVHSRVRSCISITRTVLVGESCFDDEHILQYQYYHTKLKKTYLKCSHLYHGITDCYGNAISLPGKGYIGNKKKLCCPRHTLSCMLCCNFWILSCYRPWVSNNIRAVVSYSRFDFCFRITDFDIFSNSLG